MKKIKLHITIFLLALIIYGCDKPAPTELVQDFPAEEDPVSVEVITKNIKDDTNGGGYDSTGVTDNLYQFTNVVVVNGIKVTGRNVTFNSSLALAVFFDKSSPVFSSDGKRIGFETRTLGTVEFDGYKAHLIPFKKRYRLNDASLDTTLGLFYFLYSGRHNQQDPFEFNYNSKINFALKPVSQKKITFDIPTPPEITGSINLEGRAANNSLNISLKWNAFRSSDLEIIVGAAPKEIDKILPIYRLRTRDDGSLKIPQNLLRALPSDRFDRLSFTLIRRYKWFRSENENDIYVLSQSIHTIIIGNP